jgi:hypothetical protein
MKRTRLLLFSAMMLILGTAGAQVPASPTSFTSGRVRFKQTTDSEGGPSAKVHQVVEIEKLWNGKGFSVEKEIHGAPGDYTMEVQTPQGLYTAVSANDHREVTFGAASVLLDDSPLLDVCGGPCVPLGGIPPSFVSVGNGKFESAGSTYRQQRPHGVLTGLDRLNKDGSVRSKYRYVGKLDNKGGGSIPDRAVYDFHNGDVSYTRSFQFQESEIGPEQDLSSYQDSWNQPGWTISDRRLQPEIVWTYEDLTKANGGDPKVTPDRLLELSRQRRQMLADEQAKLDREHRPRSQGSSTIIWIAAVAVLLFGATFLLPWVVPKLGKSKAKNRDKAR